MFKSTEKIIDGAFPKIVMELGGQLNAFTSQDVTVYHERIAMEHLRTMMEMEADRMMNLRLTDEDVATERQVIIEERASHNDKRPNARLNEQMNAALYLAHPYRLPVIGWAHDIAKLSRADALAFYKRYYAPNNAILVVAGDVTPDEVRNLAAASYGKIPANPAVEGRVRAKEPPHEVARRMSLEKKRVANATFQRAYLTPSYAAAESGMAEALSVLVTIIGDGATGRLYRRLVLDEKMAASAGAGYYGGGFDSGCISIQAVALPHRDLGSIAALVDADKLADRYGRSLSIGRTIADIEGWPAAIANVTAGDVKAAVNTYLDMRHSVTGHLLPDIANAPTAQPRQVPAP